MAGEEKKNRHSFQQTDCNISNLIKSLASQVVSVLVADSERRTKITATWTVNWTITVYLIWSLVLLKAEP